MYRWHKDFPITYQEWKKHHRQHVAMNALRGVRCEADVCRDIWEVDCPCDTQIGRFRKQAANDCGRPHCHLCHSDKYPKREKTYQEVCAALKLKEELSEMR